VVGRRPRQASAIRCSVAVEGPRDRPKGGRVRYVPMAVRLSDALKQARSLKCRRVICDKKGTPLTQKQERRPPAVVTIWRRREQAASLPDSKERSWWRRRESNPRPKARRRGTLHACPLLYFRARRMETAKYRPALASENLADTRRGAACPPACLMAFDPQPPGEVKANVTA